LPSFLALAFRIRRKMALLAANWARASTTLGSRSTQAMYHAQNAKIHDASIFSRNGTLKRWNTMTRWKSFSGSRFETSAVRKSNLTCMEPSVGLKILIILYEK